MKVFAGWSARIRIVVAIAVFLVSACVAKAQTYGPPGICYYREFMPYQGTNEQGADVYGSAYSSEVLTIDSTYELTLNEGSTGQYYDPVSKQFTGSGVVAMSENGDTFLGTSPGVEVRFEPGFFMETSLQDNVNSPHWGDYSIVMPDGSGVFRYVGIAEGTVFRIDNSSPWYRYTGSDLLLVYGNAGWTETNLPVPPSTLYVNGRDYEVTATSNGGAGTFYWSDTWYTDPNSGRQAGVYIEVNSQGVSWTSIWAYDPDGLYVTGAVTPYSWQVSGLPAGYTVQFGASPGYPPSYGPPFIALDGNTYKFGGTDSQGADVYVNSSNGVRFVIDSNSKVSILTPNWLEVGRYDAENYKFILNPGAPISNNFLALDVNGYPIGISAGLTIFVGDSNGLGWIRDTQGTMFFPTYTFRRADGAWGEKFVGLSQGTRFIIADAFGHYITPAAYSYSGGEYVIDAVSYGWPASNVPPATLYVNGTLCPKDLATQHDQWEGGVAGVVSGSVSYHPQGSTGILITFTYNWDFNAGFGGGGWDIQGTIDAFGSISPTWDGTSRYFSNLPDGLVITLDPPPAVPSFGPPQIDWDGVTLSFDPIASSVSAANPQGANVYHDNAGLGLRLVIDSNHSVTLYRADGSSLAGGTYNTSTYRFDFPGTNVGSLLALDSQGVLLKPVNQDGGSDGGQTMEVLGNFDVHGNVFSLGTWVSSSGDSLNAFGLSFRNATSPQESSLLEFSATRQNVTWIWSRAQTDGGANQLPSMALDSGNRLLLYSPSAPASSAPAIVLDPAGVTHFNGPVHIEPQGDIGMGAFKAAGTP